MKNKYHLITHDGEAEASYSTSSIKRMRDVIECLSDEDYEEFPTYLMKGEFCIIDGFLEKMDVQLTKWEEEENDQSR